MKTAIYILAIFFVGFVLTHWLSSGQDDIIKPYHPAPTSYTENN